MEEIQGLVGIEDVCRKIKAKPSTVYKMISRREIPFVKVGRLVKFNPKKINEWLEKNSYDVEK